MRVDPRPLDDNELGELERFLGNRPGAMPLERLDGLLCALVIGPEVVPPSEWLPLALGDSEEGFESEAQMRRVLELLLRHNNSVANGFREDWSGLSQEEAIDAMYFPLLDESPDRADPLGAVWSRGFRDGMEWLNDDHWNALDADEECVAVFSLMAALDQGIKSEGVPITDEERDKAIPAAVAGLQYVYGFWRQWLRQQAHTPYRAVDLPGRNDPCYCGSGQKYKKCCGAPDKLH